MDFVAYQPINYTSLLDTNQRISDVQFSQIMTSISDVPFPDPLQTFQSGLSMSRKLLSSRPAIGTIWPTSQWQWWSSSSESSLSLVKGTFQSRHDLKDLCIERINALRIANVPVLWALKMTGEEAIHSISEIDLLKYLILQALKLSSTMQTEGSMTFNCRRFQCATTDEEWFDLLGSILATMPKDVYLIIDLETLSLARNSSHGQFSWPDSFSSLFKKLSDRGVHTRVKVLIITYGSSALQNCSRDMHPLTIRVKSQRRGRVTRRKYSTRHSLGNTYNTLHAA